MASMARSVSVRTVRESALCRLSSTFLIEGTLWSDMAQTLLVGLQSRQQPAAGFARQGGEQPDDQLQ